VIRPGIDNLKRSQYDAKLIILFRIVSKISRMLSSVDFILTPNNLILSVTVKPALLTIFISSAVGFDVSSTHDLSKLHSKPLKMLNSFKISLTRVRDCSSKTVMVVLSSAKDSFLSVSRFDSCWKKVWLLLICLSCGRGILTIKGSSSSLKIKICSAKLKVYVSCTVHAFMPPIFLLFKNSWDFHDMLINMLQISVPLQ
jgi:hypothetical protein